MANTKEASVLSALKCPRCFHENDPTTERCLSCGQALKRAASRPSTHLQSEPTPAAEPKSVTRAAPSELRRPPATKKPASSEKPARPISQTVDDSIEGHDQTQDRDQLTRAVEQAARRNPLQNEPPLSGRIAGRKLRQLRQAWEENDGYTDAEADKRRGVMRELGQSRDSQVLDLLFVGMKDEKAIVREAALGALGELGTAEATPVALRALLDAEGDVRRAAVTALKKIADMRAVRPLLALTLFDPRLRHLALDVVVKWGSVAVPELLGTLQDRDAGLAINSVIALGRIRDPQAVPELLASLNYLRSPLLRAYAMEALGILGDKRALSVLIEGLKDSNSTIRLNSAAALLKIKDGRAIRPLVEVLWNDTDSNTRFMAAMALGEIGDPRAAPELVRMIQEWPTASDHDSDLIAAVVEALGKIGFATSIDAILPLLQSPNENILSKSLTALKRMKATQAIVAVPGLLQDSRQNIRRLAVEILALSNEPATVQQLISLLRTDPNSEIRAVSARILGERKAISARSALEDSLTDELVVRIQSVIALGCLLDKRSIAALLAMTKDVAPEVRFHAVQAVGKYADPKTVKAISVLLDDDDELVKQGTVKALEQIRERGVETADKLLRKARWRDRVTKLVPPVVWNLIPRDVRLTSSVVAATMACLLVVGLFLRTSTGGAIAPILRRGQVGGLVFSSDGKLVAAMRTEGLLECWNVESNKVESSVPGSYAALLSHDGKMALLLGQQKLFNWSLGTTFQRESAKPLFEGAVKQLLSTPEGKWAVSSTSAGPIAVWDLQQMKKAAELSLPTGTGLGIAISPDGKLIAASNPKGLVTLLDVDSGKTVQRLQTKPEDQLTQLAISADKKTVVGSGESGRIFIWMMDTLDAERLLVAEPAPIANRFATLGLQFLPDNRRFLIANNSEVKLCELGSEKFVNLPHGLNQVDTVALNSTGRQVAVGGKDNSEFVLLDLESRRVMKEFDVK